MKKKTKPEIDLSPLATDELKNRLEKNQLTPSDISYLITLLKIFNKLKSILHNKRSVISRLLRKIFGVKTEKETGKSRNKPKDKTLNRNGRRGREDFPGAEKIKIPHPDLKPGNTCPECFSGSLIEGKPNVDYLWEGRTPIKLTIFLLQKLLCHNCKTPFVADSPVKSNSDLVDDSKDSHKTARCDKNATANASIATLRFEYGIPHYRLAKLQGRQGLALPASTQYKMLKQVLYSGLPIYKKRKRSTITV